jgi:hypothetical protein
VSAPSQIYPGWGKVFRGFLKGAKETLSFTPRIEQRVPPCYNADMVKANNNAITEADIMEQVVIPGQPGFSPEVARAILGLRFGPTAVSRMTELAEKNGQDTLSDAERAEMGMYLRVGNFLNLMQAKARLSETSRG